MSLNKEEKHLTINKSINNLGKNGDSSGITEYTWKIFNACLKQNLEVEVCLKKKKDFYKNKCVFLAC